MGTDLTGRKKLTDYGSGTLGDWSGNAHGQTANWATADFGLIGDSITTLGWSKLNSDLAAKGKTLAVNYWSGRPTTPAMDWLMSNTVLPPVVIVACGTNDIFDPTVMASQVSRAVRAGTEFFWVDVQASRWSLATSVQVADQRNSMWVNRQIWDGVADTRVIPWSSWFWTSPNRLTSYLTDGIHPNPTTGVNFWSAVLQSKLTSEGFLP